MSYIFKILFPFLIFQLYFGILYSQNLSWTVYDTSNTPLPAPGSSGGWIAGMVDDQYGNKWIATGIGVFKWDGANWTLYNSSNSGLPHNVCHCIAIDKYNTIWIGTGYGGLTKFDGTTWYSYNYSNSNIPYTEVIGITINNNNDDIWIQMYDYGIARFDGTNFTHYYSGNSPLPGDLNLDLVIENDTTIWVTSFAGIAKKYGNMWTIYDTTNSALTSDITRYLTISHDNKKYVTTSNGLFIIDENYNQAMLDTGYFVIPSPSVWGIIEAHDSSIWIAGDNLIRYRDGVWTHWDISAIQPLNIKEDINNNLWGWTSILYLFDYENSTPVLLFPFNIVTAYPNPFIESTIISSFGNDIEEVIIFDVMGKHIKTVTGFSSQIEVSKEGLRQGYYVVQVKLKNSKNYLKIKLIKI
ncbi:MAG: T9SS type A sorting domain-containing protein [Bacteroidia bacterium]|nr:T9SS type A sorting domain-containing protein [Bacteroidia bacterium]